MRSGRCKLLTAGLALAPWDACRCSGPLKIISAPPGPDVVTSAQRGQLPFTSKRGITGTLDLSADTVTLSTGEVIEGQHP
jgi:hypothetical protein